MEPSPKRKLTTEIIYIPLVINIVILAVLGLIYIWNYQAGPPIPLLTTNFKDIVKATMTNK